MKKKEKFDIKTEFVILQKFIEEKQMLFKELKAGKHRDLWKKERGWDDYFNLKGDDNVSIQLHDGNKINYTKSLGFGRYVEIREYSPYEKKDVVYHSLRYYNDDGNRHEDHRTDGPAKFTTKDFKRASCEYYLDGAKVPAYFYEENFSKIQYMSSIVNIIRKRHNNYNVVSKPIEGFIRIDLPEKYIKFEDLTAFIDGLKTHVSKNFKYSVVAGYDMTLTIRMYLSKDANIENDVVLEKTADFFN